jgi:hypothetical protein
MVVVPRLRQQVCKLAALLRCKLLWIAPLHHPAPCHHHDSIILNDSCELVCDLQHCWLLPGRLAAAAAAIEAKLLCHIQLFMQHLKRRKAAKAFG